MTPCMTGAVHLNFLSLAIVTSSYVVTGWGSREHDEVGKSTRSLYAKAPGMLGITSSNRIAVRGGGFFGLVQLPGTRHHEPMSLKSRHMVNKQLLTGVKRRSNYQHARVKRPQCHGTMHPVHAPVRSMPHSISKALTDSSFMSSHLN